MINKSIITDITNTIIYHIYIMRILKFTLSLIITIVLIALLSVRLPIGSTPPPPLGKFIHPFWGFWQNAEPEMPTFPADVATKYLQNEATVYYDDRLVPHIQARSLEEAYFVQGYVTAQLRLWQMEFQVMAAAGRVSEIIGDDAIEYDKSQRRMGMVHGAELAVEKWKELEGYKYVEAYSAGVNAYIEQLSDKDLPFEYKLLDYKPEPWSPLKCALFLKNMTKTLASYDGDLEATNTLQLLGRDQFDYLFPADYKEESPVIPTPKKWDFEPAPLPTVPVNPTVIEHSIDENSSTSYRPFEEPFEGIGSNNWAVSGTKTKSGHPILCGDPHLGLTLPSIWMEMQISTPDCNVYGVTLPGIFGVIIGFNDNIAWSQTNVGRDVLDWYTIDWKDDQKTAYKYGDGYKEVTRKVETIKVRGGETVYDTVIYTHHGPVAYLAKGEKEKDMALHWIAHLAPDGDELSVFPMLNKAKNYEEYVAALQEYVAPAQNFVFAAKDGDIALWANGSYPLKRFEQGRFVMAGDDPNNEWLGTIPKMHNPHVRNPERGFVASANQKSTEATYPYYYNGRFSDYRGRYLNRKLATMDSLTIQDMMALHHDEYSLFAEEVTPLLLKNIEPSQSKLSATEKQYLELFKDWDYTFDKDDETAVILVEWFSELRHLIWDEFGTMRDEAADEDAAVLLVPENRRTIEIIKDNPSFELFDIAATKDTVEQLTDLVYQSFHEAVKIVEGMQSADGTPIVVGKYKYSVIQHLARLQPFSQYVDVGGSKYSLNANSGRGSTTWGPSWRMIVELGDEVKAYGVYPGGTSGNPGSFFYQNMIDYWATAQYYELFFMHDGDEESEQVIMKQVFTPQK